MAMLGIHKPPKKKGMKGMNPHRGRDNMLVYNKDERNTKENRRMEN